MVKNLPDKAGDVGLIPGSGRSLEQEMATHPTILAWEIPDLVGYHPWGRKELDTTEHSTSLNLQVIFFNFYLINYF